MEQVALLATGLIALVAPAVFWMFVLWREHRRSVLLRLRVEFTGKYVDLQATLIRLAREKKIDVNSHEFRYLYRLLNFMTQIPKVYHEVSMGVATELPYAELADLEQSDAEAVAEGLARAHKDVRELMEAIGRTMTQMANQLFATNSLLYRLRHKWPRMADGARKAAADALAGRSRVLDIGRILSGEASSQHRVQVA